MQQQKPNNETNRFSELRRQAEVILSNREGIENDPELMDVKRLLTELHVHQIELEIQNDELRQTQVQLVIERERYADLYNFAPVAYFTFDEKGVILDLNMAAADLLEHTRKYLSNHPIAPYLTPESLQVFVIHRQKVISSRQVQACELALRRKNGSQFIVQVRSMAIETAFGEPPLWRSVMTDVTERKRAEARLKEQATWSNFISDAIITTDLNLNITEWNEAATQIYGWSAKEAKGREIDELLKSEFIDLTKSEARAVLAREGVWRGQIKQRTHKGDVRYIEASVTFLRDDQEKITGGITVNRDITERKKAEDIQHARARVSEYASTNALDALLQYALDELCALTESPIGFFHFIEEDQNTVSLQAWSTRTIKEMCKADGKGQHYNVDAAGVWVDCVKLGRPVIHNDYARLAHRKGLPEGHSPIVREMVFPLIRKEKIVAIIGVGNKVKEYEEADMTYAMQLADMIWEIVERKRSEQKLRESEERFRTLVSSMDDVVFTLDTQQRHTGVYGDWVKRSGLTPEFFLGKTTREILGPETSPLHEEANSKALNGHTAVYEWTMQSPNGALHYQTSVSPLMNAGGVVVGVVGVGRDITVSKRAEEAVRNANEELQAQLEEIQSLQARLREQAIRDPLTGLFNRRYLQETLEREIARAGRNHQPVGIIIMDVDHFKLINDQLGHNAGDKMLREMGNVINSCIRMEDIPCRYGGEEFVIVMPGASLQAAQERANLIREKFDSMHIEYNNQTMHATASLGVAAFPLHGATSDAVLIRADRALYQSKQNGRNRVTTFQDSIRTPRP